MKSLVHAHTFLEANSLSCGACLPAHAHQHQDQTASSAIPEHQNNCSVLKRSTSSNTRRLGTCRDLLRRLWIPTMPVLILFYIILFASMHGFYIYTDVNNALRQNRYDNIIKLIIHDTFFSFSSICSLSTMEFKSCAVFPLPFPVPDPTEEEDDH